MGRHLWKLGVTLGALGGLILLVLVGASINWVLKNPNDADLIAGAFDTFLDDFAEQQSTEPASPLSDSDVRDLLQLGLKPEAQSLFNKKLAECALTKPAMQCLARLRTKRWWAVKSFPDPDNAGSEITIGKVDASTTLGDQLGSAALVFRCGPNFRDIIIAWGDHIGNQPMMVKYRFGGEPAETSEWSEASSQDSLFFHGDKAHFIKKLGETDRLTAEVTKPGGATVSAHFDLGYTQEALSPIIGKCGWSF